MANKGTRTTDTASVGTPPEFPQQTPRDLHPTSDIRFVMTEVAKLQTQHEFVQRDMGESRADMKDARDRLARLEERVAHLPSKGFIIAVVTTALVILGGLTTLAPRLWALTGAVPPGSATSVPSAATGMPVSR